jgi:hypothetical protein
MRMVDPTLPLYGTDELIAKEVPGNFIDLNFRPVIIQSLSKMVHRYESPTSDLPFDEEESTSRRQCGHRKSVWVAVARGIFNLRRARAFELQ